MPNILSFGSLNLDYVYHVPHFVCPGETLASKKRDVNCGGKGLNQSIAAARAGGKVFHAGKIGTDGSMLFNMLEESGVDTTHIYKSEGPTGHAVIQVDKDGQNCILLFGGSNLEITEHEVYSAISNFSEGDYLMLQNEINCLDYIIRTGAQQGLNIVLNPSPMDENIESLPLELISMLIINEVEGKSLSGKSDVNGILESLRKKLPNCRILLTLGGDGCVYDDGEIRLCHKAYQTHVTDTTGAGDTFTGYFVACQAAGLSSKESLDIASRAAAISVSRSGAASSIPCMDEVNACRLKLKE